MNPTALIVGCIVVVLVLSRWLNTSHTTLTAVAAPIAAQPASVAASPLPMGGECGHNARVALDASGGALRRVVIAPGATWSFNATVGNPAGLNYVSCAGVPGGYWCNLAARYAQAARALGVQPSFLRHGIDLGAGIENDVLIWNIDGTPGSTGGRQDLELTNTTGRTIVLTAREDGGAVVVEGGTI